MFLSHQWPAHCRNYVDVLRQLPRNAAKRFPKLTAREAAALARERDDLEIISTANANAHLSNLSSFLNWAVNEELLARNPMRGLRLPDEVAKRDKRFPFSPDQLRVIFNAPLYTGASMAIGAMRSPAWIAPTMRAFGCLSPPFIPECV